MKIILGVILLMTICGGAMATEEESFYIVTDPETVISFNSQPCTSIIFGTPEVGRISWANGKLTFEGNIDESAKIFFEHFWKVYVQGNKERD